MMGLLQQLSKIQLIDQFSIVTKQVFKIFFINTIRDKLDILAQCNRLKPLDAYIYSC